MATPPTFVADYEGAAWNTATSPKTTGTFDGALGDVLVALVGESNDNGDENATFTSSPAETWTERTETSGSSDCWAQAATTVLTAARTGMTVSAAMAGTINNYGLVVAHFTGSDGIGATATTAGDGTDTPALAITTLFDNSAIVYLIADWTAATGAQTHRVVNGITPTDIVDVNVTGEYSVWAAYVSDAGPAGAKTVGLTAPTGQDSVVVAVEVRGTSAAAAPAVGPISPVAWRRPLPPFYQPQPYALPAPAQVAADDPPAIRPLIVNDLSSPQSVQSAFVNATRVDPVVVAPEIRVQPTVVVAQLLPLQLPTTVVVRGELGDTIPPKPDVVTAQQRPFEKPFTLVGSPRGEAPAPQVPVKSTIVAAEPPSGPTFVGLIGFNVQFVAADTTVPRKPVLVPTQQWLDKPLVFVNAVRVAPPAAAPAVPIRPTVVTSQALVGPTVVGYTGINVANSTPTLDALLQRPPTVVPSLQPPVFTGTVQAKTPKVFAAAPVVAETRRPVIVAAQQLPVQRAFVFVSWTDQPDVLPPYGIAAELIEQPVSPPFVHISQSRGVVQAPLPQVPIRPTVVRAEPFPQPVQAPVVVRTFIDPPPPPPAIPPKPFVVGAQAYPPQMAQILSPKSGRWGNPPPNHRIIQPTVLTDLSLPFRPAGWSKVAHGFAEALPLLFEGTVVGGTLEGARVSGGVLTGSGVGGTVQNGYITGGRL